ncbi:MAG: response regulator [Verrucomicrobiota bacterium]
MNILIADDSKVVITLLEHILSPEPTYNLRIAEDGVEVWDMLESGYRPDVCLLDIEMPQMSGLELLEKMRGDERFEKIPVLLVTSKTDVTSKATAAAYQVYAYVVKPFNPQRVLALVKEALVATQREFAPVGFEDRFEVLKRERMDAPHYFKSLTYFVELLGYRMEAVQRHVEAGDTESLRASLSPLRKQAKLLGGTLFLSYFDKLESEGVFDSQSSRDQARHDFRHLRSEYNDLKDALELYLNVVIKSESQQRIATQPDMTDWAQESIRLSAEIEETNEDVSEGFSMGGQRIVLRASRGESDLMNAMLSVENGRLVLRSTLGGSAEDSELGAFDLTVFPELLADEAVQVENN